MSSYDEDDMLDFDDLREGAMNQVSVVRTNLDVYVYMLRRRRPDEAN